MEKSEAKNRLSPQNSHIRSYVGRNSRITLAQETAYAELSPQFGLSTNTPITDFATVFGRRSPLYLEIGFGSGQSLLALAKAHPEQDFIGIETHKPGIGALLLGVKREGLTNVRVCHGDAYLMMQEVIKNKALDGVQIFFPDPWQKRRHHARRLIQKPFIQLIADKLKPNAYLHLATDWDDYAKHMQHIMSHFPQFIMAGDLHERSEQRPHVTKFEARALREGRRIYDLKFSFSNGSLG